MTRMAPRSSAMASAVRNILSETGTRSPSIERMPMAKAMSVISFSTVIPRGKTQSISPSGLYTISERSVSSRWR